MPYWNEGSERVLATTRSGTAGLADDEAARRLAERRPSRSPSRVWASVRSQFLNPLVLILVVAAAVSFATGSEEDAVIILVIVAMTGGFGFVQERSAERTVEKLRALVHVRATVR